MAKPSSESYEGYLALMTEEFRGADMDTSSRIMNDFGSTFGPKIPMNVKRELYERFAQVYVEKIGPIYGPKAMRQTRTLLARVAR